MSVFVFFEFVSILIISFGASAAAYVVARFVFSSPLREQKILQWLHVLSIKWGDRIFFCLVLVYLLIFGILSALRYLAFNMGDFYISSSWDLAQYSQLTWNSMHGRLFENTIVFDAPLILGKTFVPIILAFVPLYALWSDPIVLLILQTGALAASALPVYWFAKQRIGRALAFGLGTAFLITPGLASINLHEFHEAPLMTFLLSYATFFLLRRHFTGFLVCLGVALMVKEEVAIIAIAFGIYILLVQRQWCFGSVVTLIGVASSILLLQYVIPFFRGAEFGAGFYYFSSGSVALGGSRYSYLGTNLTQIIVTLISRPDLVISRLLMPAKIVYVLQLLIPLGWLPLLAPEVMLLAVPTLGYSLLSSLDAQYSIHYWYFAPILPFIFYAAIIGTQRILNRLTLSSPRFFVAKAMLLIYLLSASIASYFFYSVGPFARHFQPARYVLTEHSIRGNALIKSIPPDASVATEMDSLAHLSGRRFIYEVPVVPDYRQLDYLVADTTSSWYVPHRKIWDNLFATGYFEMLSRQDGIIIAKRRAVERSLQIRFGDAITLLGYTLPQTTTLRGGTTLRPIVAWRADKPITQPYTMTVQVIDLREHVWATIEGQPQSGKLPTPRWEMGKEIGDQYAIDLPPTMPPGDYQLVLSVRQANGEMLPAIDARGEQLNSPVVVAPLRIEKDTRSYQARDLWWLEQPLFVDMREIRFLGYVPPPEKISAGEILSIGLYWRARAKPQGDYIVVVQLRNANGQNVIEQANRPADEVYPTTLWSEGEVLLDWHDVALPVTLERGEYRLVVLLRDAVNRDVLGQVEITTIVVE